MTKTERQRHDEAMIAVGLDPESLRTPEAKARVRPRQALPQP